MENIKISGTTRPQKVLGPNVSFDMGSVDGGGLSQKQRLGYQNLHVLVTRWVLKVSSGLAGGVELKKQDLKTTNSV